MRMFCVATAGIVLAAAAWNAIPGVQSPSHQPDRQTVAAAAGHRAGAAGFDTGIRLSNQELTAQSDLIIVGQATDSRSYWTNDGRNLYTLVTITVEQTLKGSQVATIIVALPGGIDANRQFPVAMTYPGAPSIAPDERVVLFLNHVDNEVAGAYGIAGFSQGKFTIEAGAGAADRMVRVGDALVSLSSFTQQIRSYVQQ